MEITQALWTAKDLYDVKCNFLHFHLRPFQLQNWKINFGGLDTPPDCNAETADLPMGLAVKEQSNQGECSFPRHLQREPLSSTQNKPCFEKQAASGVHRQKKPTCLWLHEQKTFVSPAAGRGSLP